MDGTREDHQNCMDFDWMLRHEIALAQRYRRCVTLLLLQPGEDVSRFSEEILPTVRQGDVVYHFDDSRLAVLMSGTPPIGARIALERYLKEWPQSSQVAFGIGSYPWDGGDASALLAAASQMLNESAGGWTARRKLRT